MIALYKGLATGANWDPIRKVWSELAVVCQSRTAKAAAPRRESSSTLRIIFLVDAMHLDG
jgi:hypothetical protein